jgi:murein DD-endopeptidase MepM/ murein hydrolase activator NlpD
MGMALRASLFVCAAAVLGACASNSGHGAAPIDFRGSAPIARGPAPGSVMASVTPPSAQQPRFSPSAPPASAPASNEPPPLQLMADLGPGIGLSATDEARAMSPEAGGRPGGSRRLGPDDAAARSVAVMPGDTLYDISRQYNVNMRALIETNRLQPPYALSVGATIQLPPPNVHIVSRGETLYSVSRRYNVDTRSLALLNGLVRPWTVYPGDELLLPPLARDQARDPRAIDSEPVVVVMVTPPAASTALVPPQAAPLPASGNKPIQLTPQASPPVAKPAAPAPKATPAPATTKPAATPKPPQAAVVPPPVAPKPSSQTAGSSGAHDFIWPVSGNVLKAFGASADGVRNDGVNIGAPRGTDIKAAATGEVVYAGSELVGFGNLVLIRHPGGWVTAYAHADTIVVKEGDLVKQGQRIGTVGQTGNASSPQLHFELRKGKEPVNPAGHLPAL